MSTADIREEVRRCVETGYVPINVSQGALRAMAEKWANSQHQKALRETARTIEKKSIQVQAGTVSAVRQLAINIAANAVQNWTDILDLSFSLPDGATVVWGDATAEQHEFRAEALEDDAAGVIETAARHRLAAEEIRSAAVACLRDLP